MNWDTNNTHANAIEFITYQPWSNTVRLVMV
jgi:hypothetical protein